MKKLGLIALLVLLGTYLNVVAFSDATHAGTFTAFGPKDYIRSIKKPVMVKDNFSVLNPHTSYTLHLYNGGKNNEFPQKVSRAAIRLNGIQVVRPKDFKQGVAHIEKPVRLSKNNKLIVILPYAPDSGMTIEIIGVDNDWPKINATLTPAPNTAGWNNTNVSVNFQCKDRTSGIASCSDPVLVETEGAGQIVTGYATDLAGNTGVLNFTVSVDKTPPSVVITEPSNGSMLQNSPVEVTGTASDALSGIAAVTCNGKPVSLSNSIYAHEMPLVEGDNLITVEATDVAGNVGHSSITVAYGAPKLVDYQKENIVPNLGEQFLTLQHHGDSLAFRIGAGHDSLAMCKHYQGIARSHGYGIPYLFLTRSGVDTPAPTCDLPDRPGELLIVEMGSRNVLGERFGSNRLKRGRNLEDYAPPIEDIGIRSIHFGAYTDSNGTPWPSYMHPGSVQLIDDVLIVALEWYCKDYAGDWTCNQAEQHGAIGLIDVSDPLDPTLITYKILPGFSEGLGVVAATYIKPGEHPEYGGKYLLAVTWGDGERLRFVVIHNDNLKTVTQEEFEVINFPAWDKDRLENPDYWMNWQTLQFFRDQNDWLYLLGGDNTGLGPFGSEDFIGLFQFNITNLGVSNEDLIEGRIKRHMRLGEPDMGSLDAASTFFVSPTGQLIFYTAPHIPRNTWDDKENLVRSVEMGEYRTITVSHTGTCGPQWRGGLPSYHLGGPYHIQGEERLTIDGRLYFIEPWVHMFEDTLEGPYGNLYMNRSGLGLMMDWGSQFLDNYNDLNNFKFTDADFKDRADAFIFCGPTDSTLFLSSRPYYPEPQPEDPYPPNMFYPLTLAGTGSVLVVPDLESYWHDSHDNVESAYIYWQKPSGSEYVWGLGGDARGTIIQTDAPHIIEYQPACGTYTDTVYMKYYNRDEWKAETQITVEDTAPPKIDRLTATPNVLWPPNHELIPVSVSVSASDNCGGPVTCQIVSVNSNEVENSIGYRDKAADWIITGGLTLKLRAERSGTGNGRIYTITVNCADSSGNNTSGDVTVSVPHDKRKKK